MNDSQKMNLEIEKRVLKKQIDLYTQQVAEAQTVVDKAIKRRNNIIEQRGESKGRLEVIEDLLKDNFYAGPGKVVL